MLLLPLKRPLCSLLSVKHEQKAREYHPDVNKENPNAQKKFVEATNAYEVIAGAGAHVSAAAALLAPEPSAVPQPAWLLLVADHPHPAGFEGRQEEA